VKALEGGYNEMMPPVEERVDRLEAIFGQFMVQTSLAILRLERAGERMERTTAEMKKQAEEDRGEWNARFEKDREEWNARFEKDRREWNKRWGELANKLGTVVEDIVAPNIPRIARQYFGCAEIEDFMIRRRVTNKKDRSRRREFDAIAVCQDVVILNETKEFPKMIYVEEFVQFLRNGEVYEYFPEYEGKKLILVLSSLYLPEDAVNYLTKHGVYAMAMSDDVMEILNFEQVQASAGIE
jgi:hypothetical protein